MQRPADNELYDRGCDLVEAAAAIGRLAEAPEAARALRAALARIEAALRELFAAAAAMEQTNARAAAGAVDVDARMHTGYANLLWALDDAQTAAAAARALAARSLEPASHTRGWVDAMARGPRGIGPSGRLR